MRPKQMPAQTLKGKVHCPICTHAVDAEIVQSRKHSYVKPGQRCPRCSASLDASCILRMDRAA